MTLAPPQTLTQNELAPEQQGISTKEKFRQSGTAPKKFAKRPLIPPQAIKLRNVDIVVLEDRCKGCSFCIEFCPRDVLEQETKMNIRGAHPPRVKDSALCVGCGVCEEICPDFAIFLVDKRESR